LILNEKDKTRERAKAFGMRLALVIPVGRVAGRAIDFLVISGRGVDPTARVFKLLKRTTFVRRACVAAGRG
jgi:hypothetical protein